MNIKSKYQYIGLFVLFTFGWLLLSLDHNDYHKQTSSFTEKYEIHNPPIPTQITFADEEIPLHQFNVRERIEKEIISNTFFHSNTILTLKRSKRFFEVVEPILKKYGVPDDFKYLAVIESNLVNAVSPAGAEGIWQFMPATAKKYGLEVNSIIDERYHLEKSTEAACLYLKNSYEIFNNWTLAAASYNRGVGGVNVDINKQGVNDYYGLHLNTETFRYVPRIIAIKTIFENPHHYGFMLENKNYYANPDTKTIIIDRKIDNIAEYAKEIGSTYHQIKSLNPWLRSNEIHGHLKNYTIEVLK
jgi:hypothetical protein